MPEAPFEPVLLDVCRVDHLTFIRQTASLEQLGFAPVSDYSLGKNGKQAFHRALVHSEHPIAALIVQRRGNKRALPHLELLTRFDDLSSLCSSNEARKEGQHPAFNRIQLVPGLSPFELYNLHLQTVSGMQGKQFNPLPVDREGFFAYYWEWMRLAQAFSKRAGRMPSRAEAAVLMGPLPAIPLKPLLRRFEPKVHAPVLPAEPVIEIKRQLPEPLPVELPVPEPVQEAVRIVSVPVEPSGGFVESSEPSVLAVPDGGLRPGDPPPFAMDLGEAPATPADTADPEKKGLCPHCGKRLLSAWASRCNHCKQPLNQ